MSLRMGELMTEPDLVTCASCGGLPAFKRARCFFCADGSSARPGVHPQAMSVECHLLSKSSESATCPECAVDLIKPGFMCPCCADGANDRPQTIPQAMSVEIELLGGIHDLRHELLLKTRRNHGLSHAYADDFLEQWVDVEL